MRRTVGVGSLVLALIAAPSTGTAADPGQQAEKVKAETGMELVRIPGGEFAMGARDLYKDSKLVHTVKVRDFYLGSTEVTQDQWKKVMGSEPSRFQGCGDCPVETVSHDEISVFLEKAGKMAGASLRLPTEAEWEYAAAGGAEQHSWAGTSDKNAVGDYAWYEKNSEDKTRPVAQKNPNFFGIYDMTGNVWEWCADWYGEDYYENSPAENPPGPAEGSYRIMRGGSYNRDPYYLRTGFRYRSEPDDKFEGLGFRVAMDGA